MTTTSTPPDALPASKEAEAVGMGVFRDGKMIGFVGLGDEFRLPEDTDERRPIYAHPPMDAGVSEAMVEAAKSELFRRGIVDVFSVRAALRAALSTAIPAGDGVPPGMVLVPDGDPVNLDDCPEGLFLFGNTLALMTEYASDRSDIRQRDAFCVESGEYFWGGTSYAKDRAKLMVQPLSTASTAGKG